MILIDTSGLLAAIDRAQPAHEAAAAAIAADAGPFSLSPFVLAELDYLLGRHVGTNAQRALLEDVSAGAYRLEPFSHGDIRRASEIIDRYADLAIGLADASIVVLAERLGSHDLLTLDERHFRAVLGPHDKPFRLLPTDA